VTENISCTLKVKKHPNKWNYQVQ